jgi:hypothetical protein
MVFFIADSSYPQRAADAASYLYFSGYRYFRETVKIKNFIGGKRNEFQPEKAPVSDSGHRHGCRHSGWLRC